jgi:hypothetical protein
MSQRQQRAPANWALHTVELAGLALAAAGLALAIFAQPVRPRVDAAPIGAQYSEATVNRATFRTPTPLGAMTLPSWAAGEAIVQSVTGSGQFDYTSDTGITALRTFALEATKSGDGTVNGQAQVNNRATGQTLNIRIDCLNLIDDIAVISGIATSATGPENTDGDAEILAVQDNGQGTNAAPDRVTRAFGNSGFVCTDITPADIAFVTSLLNDIDAGNIHIYSHEE